MWSEYNQLIMELYTAVVDTAILALLLVWSYLDRNNTYFKK